MRPILSCAALALLAAAPACAPSLVRPAPLLPRSAWVSPRYREHPLVGRIWDERQHRWIGERALDAALRQADFVLLGETHDNLDDHRLEARLVRSVAAGARRPALAFEMLSSDQQAEVDAALARHPGDPDAIAAAVDWERSGWPPFQEYRPVFAAGLAAHLPIVAADLSDAQALAVMHFGRAALSQATAKLLGPLPPKEERAWMKEMFRDHCEALPRALLEPMVLAQRARNAQLASRLVAAGKDGAILVTGSGHARTDRGVPAILARLAPGKSVVAVGPVEVRPRALSPADYRGTAAHLPYDFVVFTPAAARQDPCSKLRAQVWSI